MLRRAAQGAWKLASECQTALAPSLAARNRAFAAESAKVPDDKSLDTRDVPGLLARMMMDEAAQGKKQDALKQDVLKIVDLLEDASPDAESPFPGKLKDALPFMGKTSKNELFKELVGTDEMKSAHPALRKVMEELTQVGEAARIVDVVYRYLEMLDPAASGAAAPLRVEMTVAADEAPADLESKKAMLLSDMQGKGALPKGAKVTWAVRVDPTILGGVVYQIGDTLVDASIKSLQDEFFQSLDAAGIPRVE